MDTLTATLRAWESGTGTSRALTSNDVINQKFQATRPFHEGYDQDAVDELLDEAAEMLQVYEARSRGEGATA